MMFQRRKLRLVAREFRQGFRKVRSLVLVPSNHCLRFLRAQFRPGLPKGPKTHEKWCLQKEMVAGFSDILVLH
jgi:hypothetical protein